jgi:hypothetical protein
VYWWKSVPIPVGRPCGLHPYTGVIVNFSAISEATLIETLKLIPLGDEDLIIGPVRSPFADTYYPGTVGGAPATSVLAGAIVLPIHNTSSFIKAMLDCHVKRNTWDYEVEKIIVRDTNRENDFYEEDLSASMKNLVDRDQRDIIDKFNKYNTELAILHKQSTLIFNKIGAQGALICNEEIKNADFFAAYEKISKFYASKASSNIDVFEEKARNVLLQPGQEFISHWILLQVALKNWAMVLGLQRDSITQPPPPPKRRRGAPIEEPFVAPIVINVPESIANSGDSSDADLIDMGYRNLIPETERIKILKNSLSGSERFDKSIDIFYELPAIERTLRQFLKILTLRDETAPGQQAREREMKSTNKLTKDESSNSKTALVTTTPSDHPVSSSGKYPAGSCTHHPNSITHTTSQCRGQGKKGNNDKQNDKSPYTKPYEARNCTKCEKFNPNRRVHKTHNTENCTYVVPAGAKPITANVAKDETTTPQPKGNRKRKAPAAFTLKSPNEHEDEQKMKFVLANFARFKNLVDENPNYDGSNN